MFSAFVAAQALANVLHVHSRNEPVTCGLLLIRSWTLTHHVRIPVAELQQNTTDWKFNWHFTVMYVRGLDRYAAPATICFKLPSHAFLGDDPSLQNHILVVPSLTGTRLS